MSLLLLPALTPPIKRDSWWAAYRPTIDHVLKRLQPSHDHEISRLDIAVVLTTSPTAMGRTAFFPQFQDILRETYSLICASAAQNKVELDFPGGIDARVFFLDLQLSKEPSILTGKQFFSGPVVDCQTFVGAGRPYQVVFSVESEAGEDVLDTLLKLWRRRGGAPDVARVPCGTSISFAQASAEQSEQPSGTHHKSVLVGGTFDHLHIGHKLLIAATVYLPEPFSLGQDSTKRTITIGITGDEMLVNKKYGGLVESWEERQQRTAEFVDSLLVFHSHISAARTIEETDQPGPNGKVVKVTYGQDVEINYTRISDPYGPGITDEAITALIVSAETRAGGKAVNDKRTEKGWKALEVFEVDVLGTDTKEDSKAETDAQTFDSKISSTEIRRRLEEKIRGNL